MAIDQLGAGGSSTGSAGITTTYQMAQENFIADGNNRIILSTDGAFNVGTTSTDALINLIVQKRESGIYCTVLGVGEGNLDKQMMKQIANKGNGNYEYNVSEPQTLWGNLEQLQIADTQAPKTIVIDAGIATEENLEKLQADKRFEYVAIARKRKFESQLFTNVQEQTLQIIHDKKLTACSAQQGEETFLLCKSQDRSRIEVRTTVEPNKEPSTLYK